MPGQLGQDRRRVWADDQLVVLSGEQGRNLRAYASSSNSGSSKPMENVLTGPSATRSSGRPPRSNRCRRSGTPQRHVADQTEPHRLLEARDDLVAPVVLGALHLPVAPEAPVPDDLDAALRQVR